MSFIFFLFWKIIVVERFLIYFYLHYRFVFVYVRSVCTDYGSGISWRLRLTALACIQGTYHTHIHAYPTKEKNVSFFSSARCMWKLVHRETILFQNAYNDTKSKLKDTKTATTTPPPATQSSFDKETSAPLCVLFVVYFKKKILKKHTKKFCVFSLQSKVERECKRITII